MAEVFPKEFLGYENWLEGEKKKAFQAVAPDIATAPLGPLASLQRMVLTRGTQKVLFPLLRKMMGRRAAETSIKRDIKNLSKDFVETPKEIVDYMVGRTMAGKFFKPGMTVLDPSAGTGAILDRLIELGGKKGALRAIELDPVRRRLLRGKGYKVVGEDFLKYEGDPVDYILMNPPFSGGQARLHLAKALKVLKPGGRVSATVPWYTVALKKRPSTQLFKKWVFQQGGEISKQMRIPSPKSKTGTTGVRVITMGK